jgi:hypothetical protein
VVAIEPKLLGALSRRATRLRSDATNEDGIAQVRKRQPRRIAPGHGGMIEDPWVVLDGYLRHRKERQVQVRPALNAAGAEGMTTAGFVDVLYRDVPSDQMSAGALFGGAHLGKRLDEGRARTPEPQDIDAPWHAAHTDE